MKNNLKTFALLLMMAVCSMGAQAATVDDLVAISSDYVFIADDVTSNGTVALTKDELYAENNILAAGWNGNIVRTDKGNSSFASGGTHLNSLRIKGTQNALAFKVSGACEVTFYMQATSYRGLIVSMTLSDDSSAEGYQKQDANTAVWNISLSAGVYYLMSYSDEPGNANADLYFAGFEVTFPDDPADLYTFGLTAELNDHTIGSVGTRTSGCSHVTTSELQATYQTLTNRTLYHGSTEAFTAPLAHRNMLVGEGDKLIKTQAGETDGAETLGAYMAFTLNIANDCSLAFRSITSDLYVENKSGWYYEYMVEKNGTEVYKSAIQTIAAGQSGSGHNNTVSLRWDANLQNLTGEVTVKLIWWINSGGTTLALKDFNVVAALTDNGGTTALDATNANAKAVKRIVNGQLFIERDGKIYNALGNVVK